MIRPTKGEFKLDEYNLVICPDLTFSQLQAGDIPISGSSPPTQMGYVSRWFNGSIDGLKAEFTIQFRFEKVQQLIWEPAETSGLSGEQLTSRMNAWLLEVIGHPPPYYYDWGLISRAAADAHNWVPSISATFKSQILDTGFKDVESFYEYLRGQA